MRYLNNPAATPERSVIIDNIKLNCLSHVYSRNEHKRALKYYERRHIECCLLTIEQNAITKPDDFRFRFCRYVTT